MTQELAPHHHITPTGGHYASKDLASICPLNDRWIPRGVSFQRPRHRLIAVASLGRLSRNRSIPFCFTRYPRTALSDRWRSLGITSLMNIGGIRYVQIHSYIGHHDQACVLACKIQCISKFHEIKLKS
ncbi:hypothetical protein TNCV_138081 [Trichonephila clavipes]|nr:hypothetical protein TNCV_138081 [Trichonephila clavipes]